MASLPRMKQRVGMLSLAGEAALHGLHLSLKQMSSLHTPQSTLQPENFCIYIYIYLQFYTNVRQLKFFLFCSYKITCLPKYHGYQGILIFNLKWLMANLVAVTGTTESMSPLQCTMHIVKHCFLFFEQVCVYVCVCVYYYVPEQPYP